MSLPSPFAAETAMTLHCRVTGIRSACSYTDGLERVTFQIREASGLVGREIELPNKWGLILDDEFCLVMEPVPAPAEVG